MMGDGVKFSTREQEWLGESHRFPVSLSLYPLIRHMDAGDAGDAGSDDKGHHHHRMLPSSANPRIFLMSPQSLRKEWGVRCEKGRGDDISVVWV